MTPEQILEAASLIKRLEYINKCINNVEEAERVSMTLKVVKAADKGKLSMFDADIPFDRKEILSILVDKAKEIENAVAFMGVDLGKTTFPSILNSIGK